MATEYKLSYTASDINSKLGQIDNLAKKSEVPTKVSDLIDDSDHRTVTDIEKAAWNAKSNFSGNYNDLTNKPTIPSTDGLATENYVDNAISAIPTPDVSGQINTHNTSTSAHNDIRTLISDLTTRLNAIADSDDTTLDQMSEIVAYIKNNKTLIEQITTNKVSVSDIIDNLTTNVSNKPLSAAQGVALKALVDAIVIPTKVSELTNDSGYLTEHQSLEGLATESYVNSAIAAIPSPDMSSKQDKITGTVGQFVVIGNDGAQPIDADVARTSMGAMKAKANIFTITASTTLDLTHTESLLRVNSSNAVTITIPLNSSVAFAIGSCITITKIGTGDITISPSTGVTLNSKDSARTIDGQFSAVTLYKVATDEWDMWGALA